ncbi:hypothetical protein NEOLEDRAFT_1239988 [Neolentinus lepideus HHB14362 ss-1]|uniref:Ataxin-10 homolog n=1 Tax=Neolentinus lepideus HHB14362 ss-1 TaxID=1314782 RepID=A0A165U9Q2_9AGAM|nr:hypothetical protein NEOLEDRAFT_1239988 [Neolentinus lepideus HHB14362 ss-1]
MSAAVDYYNQNFCKICTPENALDPGKSGEIETFLDTLARALATDATLRQSVGDEQPPIWAHLTQLWSTVASVLLADDDRLQDLCLSLAKFTRNLVANVSDNQNRAWEIEPDLRRLLHRYTSYYALQEEASAALARMLGQTLCNLVTSNEELSSRLWRSYLEIPEEENVLIRLLGSHRQDVVLPGVILVLNCLSRNKDRVSELVATPLGLRMDIALLDQISQTFEQEDESPIFDVGYSVFRTVIECSELPRLFKELLIKDEIITPHQTTLLKLLDAYLQSAVAERDAQLHSELTPFLLSTFSALSGYAQNAIHKALGPEAEKKFPDASKVSQNNSSDSSAPSDASSAEARQKSVQELDLLLPRVSEALVLVSQCLITITLAASSGMGYSSQQRINVMSTAQKPEVVMTLVETLRLLDLFLPRINFGKPVGSSTSHGNKSPGFEYVKRDLVRLMGILCHETRSVQDSVRACEGIPVIMNMCVVDERNPFLREHAIFCLRNLLHDNPENQAVVDEIQPLWTCDDGERLQRAV